MLLHIVMKYFRLPYILFRDYQDFGYLTDNRNFGYDTASKSCLKVGDTLLSKVGSVFYSVLEDKPLSVTSLSKKLLPLFKDVTATELEKDAAEFYGMLAEDGFVGQDEISAVASYFSYSDRVAKPLPLAEDWQEKSNEVFKKWGSCYHLSRVHLEISCACNERCVHCYFPDTYREGTMSRDLFLRILAQCLTNNVLSITISGGEPLLNSDVLFFIRECAKNNFSINLLSNLILMTDEMLEMFTQTPLLSIQTSLYSMIPEIHDSITQVKGSFHKTKSAIERLHKNNIPMQINCPIMKQNKDSYKSVLDWAKSLNIEANSDFMLFGCFDGLGRNLQSRLDLSEVEQIIREKSFREEEQSEQKLGNQNYNICSICVSSLCIAHNGKVYPCEGWQSYTLGNINDETLAQIWNGPSTHRLRNYTINDLPTCRICSVRDYCSICLLRNANESPNGDFRDVSPFFCEIAKLKKMIKNAQSTDSKRSDPFTVDGLFSS